MALDYREYPLDFEWSITEDVVVTRWPMQTLRSLALVHISDPDRFKVQMASYIGDYPMFKTLWKKGAIYTMRNGMCAMNAGLQRNSLQSMRLLSPIP